jgi:hypothetical protein
MGAGVVADAGYNRHSILAKAATGCNPQSAWVLTVVFQLSGTMGIDSGTAGCMRLKGVVAALYRGDARTLCFTTTYLRLSAGTDRWQGKTRAAPVLQALRSHAFVK